VAKAVPGYLGQYRLLNVVHTGQTCQLWQAFDDGRGRMVAVKALLDKFAKDTEQIAYLRQEHRVGVEAAHPRIIEVLGFGQDRGTTYLAMDWFPAPNLKNRIRQGVDKIAYRIPSIIEQAAEGLGYLNKLGWVHRDIKPDNFLMNDEGQVKLIDFGLAARAKKGLLGRLLGFKGKVQGTPTYMSPEQVRNQPLDSRADVYSFGCMVHELVASKPPFTASSTNDLLNKHLKAAPPGLESADRNVTAEFAQLVKRCLAKDPDKRPETLLDFLDDFRRCRVYRVIPRAPDSAQRE
jgi:eukaryotic-like serine/threonine-protein kinase